uniref:Uncharacterized protein n=1 Tax=Rhizophagus irregularis (strain DAOM 181602 / DAOM 197198 / MUCL 43194) TaxID=747089 RepID=U9UP13_RHIID
MYRNPARVNPIATAYYNQVLQQLDRPKEEALPTLSAFIERKKRRKNSKEKRLEQKNIKRECPEIVTESKDGHRS